MIDQQEIDRLLFENRLGLAKQKLEEYLANNPADTHALNMLTLVEIKRGWLQSARDLHQKVMMLDPQNGDTHALGAILLRRRGLIDEYNTEIQLAYDIDPGSRIVILEYALYLLSLKKFDDCVALVNQFLQKSPNNYYAFSLLALAYFYKKDFINLINSLDMMRKIKPWFTTYLRISVFLMYYPLQYLPVRLLYYGFILYAVVRILFFAQFGYLWIMVPILFCEIIKAIYYPLKG